MKKIAFLIALLLVLLPSLSKADEINFDHSEWKSILAKAGKENKLVFVDAYTTWCGPCKWMSANTFTNPDVAAFFNKNFVNAKIDMEKGEGLEIAKLYGVNVYPTLLFVDAQGTLIHSELGARDAEKFLELGKKVLDPSFVSIASMGKRFDSGERDRKFLKDYLLRLSPASEEFQKVSEPFEAGMKGDGLLDEYSWEVFRNFYRRTDSEYAKYFLSHLKDFESKYGAETVHQKAYGFYYGMSFDAIRNDDRDAFEKAKTAALNSGLPTTKAMTASMDISWYQQKQDSKNYVKSVKQLFTIPEAATPDAKNTHAWIVYEMSSKKKELKTALKWVNEALEQEAPENEKMPLYFMLDTKAMLQLKLGKTEEGFKTADLAIEAAKEIGQDYSETEKEMAKYKK